MLWFFLYLTIYLQSPGPSALVGPALYTIEIVSNAYFYFCNKVDLISDRGRLADRVVHIMPA